MFAFPLRFNANPPSPLTPAYRILLSIGLLLCNAQDLLVRDFSSLRSSKSLTRKSYKHVISISILHINE